jgi:hypothetical protein
MNSLKQATIIAASVLAAVPVSGAEPPAVAVSPTAKATSPKVPEVPLHKVPEEVSGSSDKEGSDETTADSSSNEKAKVSEVPLPNSSSAQEGSASSKKPEATNTDDPATEDNTDDPTTTASGDNKKGVFTAANLGLLFFAVAAALIAMVQCKQLL